MNREIKFRAWDGERLRKVNTIGWVDESVDFVNTPRYSGPAEDFRLMQYTGLKDKNGVEIYEGDILKTFSNINKYTDSFAEDIEPKFEYTTIVRDGACFKTTYKKRPSYVLNENSGSMVEHTEVIGNIYEHNHLLG